MRRRMIAALPLLAVAACATQAPQRTQTVFFTADSAALEGEALAVVRMAARTAGSSGPVTVLGFAGPVGGVAYNRALSEARAQYVADQLIAAGVARERIRIVPRGPVPFADVPTESRRVEIRVGG